MRTTVDLEEGLLRDLRMLALASGRTLSGVVAEAVREALARRRMAPAPAIELPSHKPRPGFEGLLPGVDVTDNAAIRALLDESDAADRRQYPRS